MEVIETRKGKPSLILDGYRYRLFRKSDTVLQWRCVKERSIRCKGILKTSVADNTIIQSVDHQCVPNVAETEVVRAKFVCNKRAREEVTTPVNQIYKEEFRPILNQGYDMVAEVSKYSNIKGALCKKRRTALGANQNPETSADIDLSNCAFTQLDGSNFLLFDLYSDSGKRCLIFSGSAGKDLLKSNKQFFLDCTFKSCPKQFRQLYTFHTDVGSTEETTKVLPVAYALLEDQTKTSYACIFNALKTWGWNPERIKIDFEAAVISSIQEIFPTVTISGCSYHLNQCLWRQVQRLGLTTDYKENEQFRMTCRMTAALAYLPLDKVEDGWLAIMGQSPNEPKLQAYLDYFVNQWMDNAAIPIAIWNVHEERHRTNNPVEGWNSKFNRLVGNPHPNIYLFLAKLKDDAERANAELMAAELCLPTEKRRKTYIQVDLRIKRAIDTYADRDVLKCLRALAYATKFE